MLTFTNRTALLSLLVAVGGACAPAAEQQPGRKQAALGGSSELISVFDEAARESGVPAELLATIGYVQTRLSNRLDQDPETTAHGMPVEWGLMALGGGGLTNADVGAELLGIAPEYVKSDPRSNVRAAAAILATLAADRGLEPKHLSDWSPALEAYGGPELAVEVLSRIERGWRGYDDDQRWVIVTARSVGGSWGGIGRQSFEVGYNGAIWNPAVAGNYANAARGAAQINNIVIHTTQGSYGGTISWFKNTAAKVSSHYVIRSSDGQITQMVDDVDVAYHDACFNTNSIGIEHEGFVADPNKWYTEAMYASSARLTAWLAQAYGVPVDRAHIQGHGETADCSTHTDPGSGWNWAHYMDLVKTGGKPVFKADPAEESFPMAMTSGDEGVAYFEFVNTGNATWGLDETRLGTQDPQDRESAFFVDGNWLAKSRATGADHSNYGPGAAGRFTFAIKAPEVTEPTTFEETFQLVQEGVEWFGPKVTMSITVSPRAGTGDGDGTGDGAGEGGTDDSGGPSDADRGDSEGGCRVVAGGAGGAGTAAGGTFALLALCAMLRTVGSSRSRRRR